MEKIEFLVKQTDRHKLRIYRTRARKVERRINHWGFSEGLLSFLKNCLVMPRDPD
jgi:hypothetical protein